MILAQLSSLEHWGWRFLLLLVVACAVLMVRSFARELRGSHSRPRLVNLDRGEARWPAEAHTLQRRGSTPRAATTLPGRGRSATGTPGVRRPNGTQDRTAVRPLPFSAPPESDRVA